MIQQEKSSKFIFIIPALAVSLVGILSCNANHPSKNDMSGNGQSAISPDSASKSDAEFLVKAANINLEEIQLGQLAQDKGFSDDVKELGRLLADDHTKAQSDLAILAQQKSVTIPKTWDANAQNDYNDLNKESGSDFDKKYCDMMVSGHKDAIEMFEKDSAHANDPDIKQFAISTLPTLRKHLNHALLCQENCKKM